MILRTCISDTYKKIRGSWWTELCILGNEIQGILKVNLILPQKALVCAVQAVSERRFWEKYLAATAHHGVSLVTWY